MTDAERLGIRIGLLNRRLTASDARYEAQRCLCAGSSLRRENKDSVRAAENWENLADILIRKAERAASIEERKRIEREQS